MACQEQTNQSTESQNLHSERLCSKAWGGTQVPKSQTPRESHHTALSFRDTLSPLTLNTALQSTGVVPLQKGKLRVNQPARGECTPPPPPGRCATAEAAHRPGHFHADLVRGHRTTARCEKRATAAPRTSSREENHLAQEPEQPMQVGNPIGAGRKAGPAPTPTPQGWHDRGGHRLPGAEPTACAHNTALLLSLDCPEAVAQRQGGRKAAG